MTGSRSIESASSREAAVVSSSRSVSARSEASSASQAGLKEAAVALCEIGRRTEAREAMPAGGKLSLSVKRERLG